MSKSAILQLTMNTYKEDGSLLPDAIEGADGKIAIPAYDLLIHGDLQVVDIDGAKPIDFEGIISPKGFILKNKGTGAIIYKFSGAASSGTLLDNSVIAIFNASINAITVETGNTTPVDYEYWVFG